MVKKSTLQYFYQNLTYPFDEPPYEKEAQEAASNGDSDMLWRIAEVEGEQMTIDICENDCYQDVVRYYKTCGTTTTET